MQFAKPNPLNCQICQKLGDCLNYHIHGRSWQRNINLFIEAGIISCERQCPSESYNYHVIKASIHAFVKSEPIERIEFEKNLLNLGIVNNYEKYIDYNNLLFHVCLANGLTVQLTLDILSIKTFTVPAKLTQNIYGVIHRKKNCTWYLPLKNDSE
ncbi:hypothetical protein [Acinetobacter johnsonii]|uniref:hypothetical protein n=1 Tax=Acinetobacter johnsonii TaxID=40214 RepID=UPI001E34EB74|nr:hypothetical protein [Acinetobacter johnsonii]